MAARGVCSGNRHRFAEAHSITHVDHGGVGGVGDIDDVTGDRGISRGAGGAIAQGEADGRVAGRRITSVGDTLRHIINQGGRGSGAAAGKGDRQRAAGGGEGGEGLATGLQVAAADCEQCARGIEVEGIRGDGCSRALHGQARARPVAIAAIERTLLGIAQNSVASRIQRDGVAGPGPGDAVAVEVADAGCGVDRDVLVGSQRAS